MDLRKYKIKEVHISDIKSGDTIVHTDLNVRTVTNSNIKKQFGEITLFGDSYKLGTIPVKKVII